ncbi:hypothetical protein ABTM55_19410, partial [Acinetobacter baumannii]
PAIFEADAISSLLQQHYYVHPAAATWIQIILFLLLVAYVALAVPRLGGGLGAGVTGLIAVVLLGTQIFLMTSRSTWIELAIPALF